MAAKKKIVCTVVARSVVGKRGKVYDVKAEAFGETFYVTGSDRKKAVDEVARDIEYVRLAEACTHENGFSLYPQSFEAWVLQFPHGGSYVFAASDLAAACERLENEYTDHAEIQEFLRDAIRVEAPVFLKSRRDRKKASG